MTPAAEGEVTRQGILRATVSDNFARKESETAYTLHSAGATTRLLPTLPVSAATGDRVEAVGTMHQGQLVGQVTEEQGLTADADVVGPHKVAVLMMRFPGDTAQPWTLNQAREEVFTGTRSANAFLQEETWGRISLAGREGPDGDVFGWFTVNNPSGCAEGTWDAEAKAAAESEGISLGGYDHIIYISTFQLSCSWLGKANIGGGTVNINGTVGGSQVISHELGHNLSLRHAGSWTCTNAQGEKVAVSNSCTTQEYGDPFDVMGNLGMRHSSAWNLRLLGLIGLSDGSIQTVTSDGTYTLQSALNPSPTPHVLRIARADSPPGAPLWWYYLETRQQGGLFEDFGDATTTGVSIRVIQQGSATETRLIDNTPTTGSFADAPLQVGHTFSDGHVHVTVISAGGGTASVSVGFGAYADGEAPTAPANLSAGQVGADIGLQWNPSSDNVRVSRYVVFRDGSEIGTGAGTSFTDKSVSVGTHAYTVYAEDEAGNVSNASTAAVVTAVDAQKPSAPTGLSASLDTDAGSVALRWSPSTDNVGVARYLVFRDALPIGTSTPESFTDPGVSAGSHSYTVYAEDAAGNRSPSSVAVAVAVPGPAGSNPPAPESAEEPVQPAGKPVLQWRRRSGGGIVFLFDASAEPDVYRVSLWLGNSALYSKAGDAVRYFWKPKVLRCRLVYRFIARAQGRNGKAITSVVRLKPGQMGSVTSHCSRR
jgi:hypothetical protein